MWNNLMTKPENEALELRIKLGCVFEDVYASLVLV